MTNREKFLNLVSEEKTDVLKKNKQRIANRARLRESQDIALKVLTKLDELGWTQARLAREIGVSRQQVSKVVKGKENLTLETQIKLQNVLEIPILASFYEKKVEELVFTISKTIKIHLPDKKKFDSVYRNPKTWVTNRKPYTNTMKIAL